MSGKFAMYCCENSAAMAVELVSDPDLMAQCDIVPLPCSGRVESALILKTFERGYDGVLVLGCPEENCKYVTGNKRAANRIAEVTAILSAAGLRGQVMMEYVSSVDAHKVEHAMRNMCERIKPSEPVEAEGA